MRRRKPLANQRSQAETDLDLAREVIGFLRARGVDDSARGNRILNLSIAAVKRAPLSGAKTVSGFRVK